MKLYEDWQKLREKAAKNAEGHLPEGFSEDVMPPPPPLVEDLDIENLSMELSAASLDAGLGQDLDDIGIERVPMADPGLEVRLFQMQRVRVCLSDVLLIDLGNLF